MYSTGVFKLTNKMYRIHFKLDNGQRDKIIFLSFEQICNHLFYSRTYMKFCYGEIIITQTMNTETFKLYTPTELLCRFNEVKEIVTIIKQ